MTNYVRRTGAQKKKDILAKREDELSHQLRQESNAGPVERMAERVREAQLGVIKALLYETEPARAEDKPNAELRANLLAKREHWLNLTVDEIVEKYRAGL